MKICLLNTGLQVFLRVFMFYIDKVVYLTITDPHLTRMRINLHFTVSYNTL